MDGAGESARLSLGAAVSPLLVMAAFVVGCGGVVWGVVGGPTWVLIAVWAAPVVSLAAVVVGLLGLRSIERGEGAVVGRPLGLAGVFVGVAATVLLGVVALMSAAVLAGSATLAPEVARVAMAAQDGRVADAKGALSVSARSSVSDEALVWFGGRLEAEAGRVTGAGAGLRLLRATREVMAGSSGAADAEVTVDQMPRPVILEFEGGAELVAYGWVDEDELASRRVLLKDLLVVVGPGRVVLLRDVGPGRTLALAMGWEAVSLERGDGGD